MSLLSAILLSHPERVVLEPSQDRKWEKSMNLGRKGGPSPQRSLTSRIKNFIANKATNVLQSKPISAPL